MGINWNAQRTSPTPPWRRKSIRVALSPRRNHPISCSAATRTSGSRRFAAPPATPTSAATGMRRWSTACESEGNPSTGRPRNRSAGCNQEPAGGGRGSEAGHLDDNCDEGWKERVFQITAVRRGSGENIKSNISISNGMPSCEMKPSLSIKRDLRKVGMTIPEKSWCALRKCATEFAVRSERK